MRTVWIALLAVSGFGLAVMLLRHRVSWSWISRFALHLTVAAIALYALNGIGLIPGMYIPLNPATIGTVVVLGLPGVALLAGLQMTVI